MYYKLDEAYNVVACDVIELGRTPWGNKRIRAEDIGVYRVSTVFLGIDHNLDGTELHVFETMVFDADHQEIWMERCSTYVQAQAMHERGFSWLKEQLDEGVLDT